MIRSSLCPGARINFAGLGDADLNRMEPAKIFDDFYLLGMKSVVAWALTTSEGIVLFESMFDYTVEENVVDYLVQLDLDPSDIKYVIISHAHIDHYGGAKHLQDTYGARIVMSVQDWEYMRASAQRIREPAPPPFPQDDIAVGDGYTLTLGDTTINLILTPGHTPGTLSAVFPVHDGNDMHYVGYLGGSGIPASPQTIVQFMSSVDRLAYGDSRIDTPISNHPMVDGTLLKLDALAQRESGDPHPFVRGNAGFKDWLSVIHDCAGEVLERRLAETLSDQQQRR